MFFPAGSLLLKSTLKLHTQMLLSDEDKVFYLGNVLLIALADKNISPQEGAVLDQIRKGIGAKKNQLNVARKMVEAESYTFRKTDSFSDQIHNLEDMLSVALVDSDLSEHDLVLVKQYCRLVGIYEDQLDTIISETSRRYDALLDATLCPACSKSVPSDARFCPSCGKTIARVETTTASEVFQIPREGYALEFCESTSGGFMAALEIA